MIAVKRISAGNYSVVGTSLTIERGGKPDWGCQQEWNVCRGEDWLFLAWGLENAKERLSILQAELSVNGGGEK